MAIRVIRFILIGLILSCFLLSAILAAQMSILTFSVIDLIRM